jgi:rhodanese-related sulfurtransferase
MKNKILIGIAVLFGVIAVFAGNPQKRNDTSNEKEFYNSHTLNYINSLELANLLIEGKSDLKVYDLRSEKEYSKLSIPGSENIAEIDFSTLNSKEMIVLVGSESKVKSNYMKLYNNGFYGVVVLENGIEGWENKVLNLDLTSNPKAKELYFVSKHFGGNPKGYVESAPVVGQSSAAAAPKAGAKAPMKKKSGGGGC